MKSNNDAYSVATVTTGTGREPRSEAKKLKLTFAWAPSHAPLDHMLQGHGAGAGAATAAKGRPRVELPREDRAEMGPGDPF